MNFFGRRGPVWLTTRLAFLLTMIVLVTLPLGMYIWLRRRTSV
jgi:hypothetical protein